MEITEDHVLTQPEMAYLVGRWCDEAVYTCQAVRENGQEDEFGGITGILDSMVTPGSTEIEEFLDLEGFGALSDEQTVCISRLILGIPQKDLEAWVKDRIDRNPSPASAGEREGRCDRKEPEVTSEATLAERMHMLACPGSAPVLDELDWYLDYIHDAAEDGKTNCTFDQRLGGYSDNEEVHPCAWDKVSCCKVRDALAELGFAVEVNGYPASTTVWRLHVAW